MKFFGNQFDCENSQENTENHFFILSKRHADEVQKVRKNRCQFSEKNHFVPGLGNHPVNIATPATRRIIMLSTSHCLYNVE